MSEVLTVLFTLTLVVCLIGLLFRRLRRKAVWGAAASFVGLVVVASFGVRALDESARQKGFLELS